MQDYPCKNKEYWGTARKKEDIRARGGLRVGCRLVVGEAFHWFLETG